MAEQLPLRGVADGALIAQLFQLAHVVKNRSHEQQIHIQFRIMLRNMARQTRSEG
jgi:hypothetical protein